MNDDLFSMDMSLFNLDPIGGLNQYIDNTHAEMSDTGRPDLPNDDDFAFDQFLTGALVESGPEVKVGPLNTHTSLVDTKAPAVSPPNSSESEGSRALDMANDFGTGIDLDFNLEGFEGLNFDLEMPAIGIMHSMEDVPAYAPAAAAPTDNTLQGMLPFGSGAGNDVAGLDMADFIAKFAPAPAVPAPAAPAPQTASDSAALAEAYVKLGWASPVPTSITPAQLSLVPSPLAPSTPLFGAVSMKRKNSDEGSDASAPAKRPRGRPPKARTDSASTSAAPNVLATPLVHTVSVESEAADPEPVKRTASGKPSTARPKSVVPEKWLKDGSAQALLGMTIEEIQSYPTFEELLKAVRSELRSGAEEFGKRIAENRDRAKDAAKKSREERKAKVESLEQEIEGLQGEAAVMKAFLRGLMSKGLPLPEEVMRVIK